MPKQSGKIRQIHYGDNLPILREMPDESADLVYLDPPFNSNRDYFAALRGPSRSRPARSTREARRQIKAFHDTWEWSPLCEQMLAETAERSAAAGKMLAAFVDGLGKTPMSAYLANMAVRLAELRRVMRPTASIYLHCDPTADGYLRVLMDAVFGARNFRNEIIWCYRKWTNAAGQFQRNHDTLLFYSAGGGPHVFNKMFAGESRPHFERGYTTNVVEGGVRQLIVYDREKAAAKIAEKKKYDRVVYREGKTRTAVPDWWEIPIINSQAVERTGYPTQKPLALLERIVAASSNPGDVVLDPFCGGGGAPMAAEKLGRQWIGIDIAYRAVSILRERMTRESDALLADFDGRVDIIGEPKTVAEVREKTGSAEARARREFEVYCITNLGGNPNKSGGPDGGVDGRIPIRRHPGHYAIAEVKSGRATIDDLRALSDLTRQEAREPVGILILRECPPKALEKWRAEAKKRGEWRKGIPRLQVWTLDDIVAGRSPQGFGR